MPRTTPIFRVLLARNSTKCRRFPIQGTRNYVYYMCGQIGRLLNSSFDHLLNQIMEKDTLDIYVCWTIRYLLLEISEIHLVSDISLVGI